MSRRTRALPAPRAARAAFLAAALASAAAILSSAPDLGPSPLAGYPDNAALRAELAPALVLGPKTAALAWKAAERSSLGAKVRVSVEKDAKSGAFLVRFENRLPGGAYSPWARGSWTFGRRLSDASQIGATLGINGEPDCYASFRPFGPDRVRMDLVLYGGAVARDVPLGIRYADLATAGIDALRSLAPRAAPWAMLSPPDASSWPVAALSARVAAALPLAYADDGAMDEAGRPVLIASGAPQPASPGLNCSGFAKWIVDGLLGAGEGGWLPIGPLKEPGADFAGSAIDEALASGRDLRFGMDWIRNLALALDRARRPSTAAALGDDDVEASYFSYLAVPGGYEPYGGYTLGAGYELRGLEPLLASLAAARPDDFYLVALGESGGAPALRAYSHMAALFPWYDSTGRLRVDLYESGEKTSFDRFLAINKGRLAFLVSIRAESIFDPPPAPKAGSVEAPASGLLKAPAPGPIKAP